MSKKSAANVCKIILTMILISLLFVSCVRMTGQKHSFKIEYGEGGADLAQVQDLMDGEYEEGTRIGLDDAAQSMPGYKFTNWTSSNGGSFVNEDSDIYFIMPGNDTVLTAQFAQSGQ